MSARGLRRTFGLHRFAGGDERSKSRKTLGNETIVSAGAKIPIVPVEFSPPLNVVNRSPLHTEEVPKLVKGERRARTKRTATARNEHPGHQQVDRLGPQDDSQVHAQGWHRSMAHAQHRRASSMRLSR